MTDGEAREMARDLVRGSIIEDAAAQFIAQILKHAHDERIKPLKARAEAAEAQIAALTARVEGLTGALRKAEQDFYEAANRFQDEDYEGPHEKFTVNVVCHIKPYFDMNMKHLRDSAAAARATLSATTEAPNLKRIGTGLYETQPTPDPAAIREAWEKAYWRMRSYAIHDNDCKLNKPPHFNGPCSCGLTAALEDALALIQMEEQK